MRLVVTFALDAEFAPWRRRHPFQPLAGRAAAGVSMYGAEIGGIGVCAVLTGIGPVRARAVEPVLAADRPDACVAAGLAGALAPSLACGRVVVARGVAD
ncbi:MAG: hypothetical protein KGN76_03480, partial [Acidobacteriota bacterium]|nr:hypothetical protein [Acidobacteriota bacterium]